MVRLSLAQLSATLTNISYYNINMYSYSFCVSEILEPKTGSTDEANGDGGADVPNQISRKTKNNFFFF